MIQTAADVQIAATSDEVAAWCHRTEAEAVAEAETILFVEDEAFVREVTAEVLRSAGYRVLTAQNAVEAARAYAVHCRTVDLLLTDVILPGETGRALAEGLRRQNPELKILFVSGYAEQMQTHEAGVEECLAKPFSGGVLLRKVRHVLHRGEPPVGGGRFG
jgi:CheY-like chemotaxis protein